MPNAAKKLVQQTEAMVSHYYKPGYPILSFMYGLYCDPDWSKEAFDKWEDSNYEYEGYLDPYPNMPHGARQLITVEVPKTRPAGEEGARAIPTVDLAEQMWPYLTGELTFDSPTKVTGRRDEARRPTFSPGRPVLSTLSMIYLIDEMPNQTQLRTALSAPKYSGKYSDTEVFEALSSIYERHARPSTTHVYLEVIKEALVVDFTAQPFVW